MARWKKTLLAAAPLAAFGLVVAAAGAADSRVTVRRTSGAGAGASALPPTNEQIVADFLRRRDEAARAQRAIVNDLRRALDVKRAEFEDTKRRFDAARTRYSEIVGTQPNGRVTNPADPIQPYEYEFRKLGPESTDPRAAAVYQKASEVRPKPIPARPAVK